MKDPDLATLRCFVAVAHAGGIAAGARKLDLATSAVSKRLSDLESRVGHTLLERGASGVRLTSAGETVLRRAEHMLAIAKSLGDDLSAHATGERGEVRLAAVAAAVSGRLADDLADFEQAYPGIRVMLSEGMNLDAAQAVAEGTAGVGVVVDHHLPPGLMKWPYADDPVWVIGKKGHPLFDGVPASAGIRFEQAIAYDVIALSGGASIESLLAAAATTMEREVRKHFEVSRYDSLRRLVEVGLGIGFIRESGVTRYLPALGIEGRPLDEPWANRRLCIIRREASEGRALGIFIDHLIRRARPGSNATAG